MRRTVAAALGAIMAGATGAVLALAAVELLPRVVRRRRPPPDGIQVAARLLVLVGTGLPLLTALQAAAAWDPGMSEVARKARRLGTAAALASVSGPLAPLLHRLADSVTAGSPPEPAIRSYIERERRRRQTRAVERARRMPVKLLPPMTLLVLPGFVLLVYGPAFIDLVMTLIGPLE